MYQKAEWLGQQMPKVFTGNKTKLHITNKHIERATWEDNIESYPNTTPGTAIAITLGSMLIAFVVIELIFGADDLIYWVASLIA